MYIRLHCLQQLWSLSMCFPNLKNHFAIKTVRFQVQLEADGFFLLRKFRVCIRSKQGELVPTYNFLNLILQIRLQKHLLGFAQTQYSAQECASSAQLRSLNKQISWRKIRFLKIVVDTFNIAQNRKYHFLKIEQFYGMLYPEPFTRTGPPKSGFLPQNRTWYVLKTLVWLWYAFYKPSSNLENRMTVCMGYPAMTPQGRAGKRRWKGVGSPCRENGTQNLKSRWYEKPEPVVPILPWNSFHIP